MRRVTLVLIRLPGRNLLKAFDARWKRAKTMNDPIEKLHLKPVPKFRPPKAPKPPTAPKAAPPEATSPAQAQPEPPKGIDDPTMARWFEIANLLLQHYGVKVPGFNLNTIQDFRFGHLTQEQRTRIVENIRAEALRHRLNMPEG